MKKLVLGSLVAALVSQIAGCVITSDGGGDEANINATWELRNVGGGGTGCPVGYDTAVVVSQEVTATGTPIGTPFRDLYDCVDGRGHSAPLPPGRYQAWVEITSDDLQNVYAQSLSGFLDITDVDQTISVQILHDGGYFALSWELIDAQTNTQIECSDVLDLGGVGVVSTSVSNPNSFKDDKFDCEDHYGITAGLLQGTYTVSIDAMNRADQSISPVPVNLTNKTIVDRNRVTDLGTVNIPVE